MASRVAYIVSRFPKLSETFILREMIAIEKEDCDVSLFPIILENAKVVHPEARSWLERLHYHPWFSLDIVYANFLQFLKSPTLYISLWYIVAKENASSLKFLVRALLILPKAVRIAADVSTKSISHIHAHFATHPALVAWVIHKLTGISYSITVHAHDIFVDRSMLGVKLQDAAFIVSISEFNREFLSNIFGDWVARKTYIIHCGIQAQVYEGPASPKTDSQFDILSIGSLQPYKGMQYLIEACAILKSRGIPIHCRIVGEGEDRQFLEDTIRRFNIHDSVELLGARNQQEVASFLKEAKVYVQPSVITPSGKMEGIPVSIMEAFAAGLPVIASKISGIPELVVEGETGYLVPPEDANKLAEMLEYVYSDLEKANLLAQSGREKVLREFEIEASARDLARLFQGFAMKV